MTEEIWLSSADPNRMLRHLWRTLPRIPCAQGYTVQTPRRKLRLFAVASCRRLLPLFRHSWHYFAVDATEEAADGDPLDISVRRAIRELHDELNHPTHPDNHDIDAAIKHATLPHELWEATEALMVSISRALTTAWGNRKPPGPENADLLRDVIGNPFRPVAFAPAWRTSTAVGVARAMYEARDFAPMPVLADALEEAGCDNPDVLAHCRGDGPHVRGCWVVDAVLGKA